MLDYFMSILTVPSNPKAPYSASSWELRIINYPHSVYLRDYRNFDELDKYLSEAVTPHWILSAFFHVPKPFYYYNSKFINTINGTQIDNDYDGHGIDQRLFDWRDCYELLTIEQVNIINSFFDSYDCIEEIPPTQCARLILDSYVCKVTDFLDASMKVTHADLALLIAGSIYYDGLTIQADKKGYLLSDGLIFRKHCCFTARFSESEFIDVDSLAGK